MLNFILINPFIINQKNITMKKFILVLMISLISIIVIFSCRKAYEPQLTPDQGINSTDKTELKIQSFINSMNSQLKSGSTYSIEEAIWYAEATLNFSYAIYDSSFIYLSRKSSSFSIDLNSNNTVDESELLAAYGKMVDSLEAHYDGIRDSPKHVFLCDVIDVSNSVGTLDLLMVSVIGCGFTYPYGSFDATDFWFAGGGLGKCGDYYPSYIGRDATTELEYKLLHPYITPAPNVRIYYTDIATIFDVYPHDYPYQNAPRGYRAYYFYSNDPEAGIQCLPPNELNFYISGNGIPYIIAANDTYIDKEFCNMDVKYDMMASTEFWIETHFLDISYGVRNETEVPAIEL
jgi:hypothetical protein